MKADISPKWPGTGRAIGAAAVGMALILVGGAATGARLPTANTSRGVDDAVVRVNLVGYDGPGSKRAYLMASSAENGATFAVKDARRPRSSRPRSGRSWARGARATHSSTRWTSDR